MKPSDVLPMVMPSAWTTILFVVIVLAVCGAVVAATHHSGRVLGHPPQANARDTQRVAWVLVAYLGVTAAASASGIFASDGLPPPMMLFFGFTNALAVGLGLSRFGKRLALGVPLAALVGVQAFRLPLELVLHRWFVEGVLPVQMTYAGANFDIVSGIGGAAVGLWLWKGKGMPSLLAVWAYNIVGLGLLLAVATIAVLSSPVPVRRFMADPPVQLALHVPYSWIVPFCVGGALFAHVVTFRALLARRG